MSDGIGPKCLKYKNFRLSNIFLLTVQWWVILSCVPITKDLYIGVTSPTQHYILLTNQSWAEWKTYTLFVIFFQAQIVYPK